MDEGAEEQEADYQRIGDEASSFYFPLSAADFRVLTNTKSFFSLRVALFRTTGHDDQIDFST